MKSSVKVKIRFLALLLFFLFLQTSGAFAETGVDSILDETLARKYAPVLYFHPDELFRPQSVEVLVNSARLRAQRRFWFDVNVLLDVTIADFLDYQDRDFFLDAWYGSEGISEYKNYTYHREIYRDKLGPDAGGPPILAYAHVSRNVDSGGLTIQYWLFYYFNDWFNKHEGDWEMLEVILDSNQQPAWVVLSQHHSGARRAWSTVQVEQGSHPAVYVGLGSHANYFWGDEVYPNGMTVGKQRVEVMDRTGVSGRVIPEIELIPDPDQVQSRPDLWTGSEWVLFGGHWGEIAQVADFSGPYGPAFKGEIWEQPYEWGLSQPLDTEVWYANRLRIEVNGDSKVIRLESSQDEFLEAAEVSGGLALLHRDPMPGEVFTAALLTGSSVPYSITVHLPDPALSQVIHSNFVNPPLSEAGLITLTLPAKGVPSLTIPGASNAFTPLSDEKETATWDAPDIVWIGGFLPATSVLLGLLLCLLMGWVPALLYIRLLYWIDRYEKEPLALLATAFIWGAIPAVLIAVFLQVFVDMPSTLFGAGAVGGILPGWILALVEETLKGIIVLWIAIRYRREFDNVLDGIIYGGMVGIGFAMNANIIHYISAFLTRGFDGLGFINFMEGVLYLINHAFFTSIFGAGLGYARLSVHRTQKWSVPLAAFLLAVITRFAYDWRVQHMTGLDLATIIFTLMGLLALMIVVTWSLRRQHRCLAEELVDVLPSEIYRAVLQPGARIRVQWRLLVQEGFQSWRKHRRLYQLSAEYAFKRQQTRLNPDEEGIAAEVQALGDELRKFTGIE